MNTAAEAIAPCSDENEPSIGLWLPGVVNGFS
jgi:hypothetical protein